MDNDFEYEEDLLQDIHDTLLFEFDYNINTKEISIESLEDLIVEAKEDFVYSRELEQELTGIRFSSHYKSSFVDSIGLMLDTLKEFTDKHNN